MVNPFFKNSGPFTIEKLLSLSKIDNLNHYSKIDVKDIKDLQSAENNSISFFHSKKYETYASQTKASFCITTKNLSHILPNTCKPVVVKNVLIATAMITKVFYPDSVTDDFDIDVNDISATLFYNKVKFGKNVLVGRNIEIGENCLIGHNSIIESNVKIGDNCSIGSNVILRNSIIKNNVNILDGCVIGKKGLTINKNFYQKYC